MWAIQEVVSLLPSNVCCLAKAGKLKLYFSVTPETLDMMLIRLTQMHLLIVGSRVRQRSQFCCSWNIGCPLCCGTSLGQCSQKCSIQSPALRLPGGRAAAVDKLCKSVHGLRLGTIAGHGDFQLCWDSCLWQWPWDSAVGSEGIASQFPVQFSGVEKRVSFLLWLSFP